MSNTTECIEDFNLDKILFPFVYIFVVVVSIPVNCAFLCVSCIQVRKKNELAIYLFSLSLADLLYTLTLPLWIDYTWHQDNWRFSALLCQISAFLMYMNFYTSAAFLTCISIDRYLAVVHPLRFQHLRTRRFALLVSIFVWVLEGSLNCMILVMDETFTKVCNSTSHNLCNDKYPLAKWQAILNIIRICSGYMIPLAIMLFCYQKIYQAVRHNQATEDREKKKIKNLLLSITITFFFCFTPYHVVLLIRSINEPDNANVHMFTPYRITQALTSFNCIADPILYCFVSETGRTDILNMLKRCFCVRQSELQQPKDVTMISSITKNATTVTLKSSTEL